MLNRGKNSISQIEISRLDKASYELKSITLQQLKLFLCGCHGSGWIEGSSVIVWKVPRDVKTIEGEF